MKKKLLLAVALVAMLSVCLLAAVGCDSDPAVKTYTVTFDVNGGTMSETMLTVNEGTTLNLTDYTATKTDYNFDGWTLDDEIVTTITVNADVTLKAKWTYAYIFRDNDDGTLTLTSTADWYNPEEAVLPAEYNGKTVTAVKADALSKLGGVKVLTIGKNYVNVEAGALSALKNLQSLTVPFAGTTKQTDDFAKLFAVAGDEAADYAYTVSLGGTDYLVPNSLASVTVNGGSYLLDVSYNKYKFESVTIASEDITELPARLFSNNDTLQNVDLSGCKNLTVIGSNNFSDCKNLKNVNLGGLSKLEKIDSSCFYYYNWHDGEQKTVSYDSINLSGLTSLKVVGQMSFWYMDIDELDFSETAIQAFGRQSVYYCNVKNVKLPDTLNLFLTEKESKELEDLYSMDYLDNSQFLDYCECLQSVTVSPLNLYITEENGAVYDYDKTTLLWCLSIDEQYTAPATLKKIGNLAFANSSVKNVDLTTCTVNKIGSGAFSGLNATISVGFDSYGWYASDGSKVDLGNNWTGGCTVNYGTRYLFFTVDVKGITDGMTVSDDSVKFTVSATYGDDKADVVVKVNNEVITAGADGYTANLIDGVNAIEVFATFDGKTSDSKTFTVNKTSKWTLKTSLTDGKKVVWANSDLQFTVWAENANGEKQNINGKVNVYVDCGYSTSFVSPFSGVEVTYNADNTIATVKMVSDTLIMSDYDVTKDHHIKVEVKQSSSIAVDKIFEAKYYEHAPSVSSETPTSGNSVSGNAWTITLQCKIGTTASAVSAVAVEAKTDGDFFPCMQATSAISDDKLTVTVTIDIETMGSWGYIYEGDTFAIKVKITLENGLTAEQVFNATYEG